MMDKVTEAFQSMIAYPMQVDESDANYLGVHSPLAGAISPFFTDIYAEWPNPNQAIFNYILNHTDVIRYGGDNSSADAQYVPAFSTQPRQITVFHGFYEPDVYWMDSFRMPFIRASTLAHEARHGDSILHDICLADQTGVNGGFSCDNELAGAYGFAGVYLKYLLHGSATCSTPGCQAPMDDFSIEIAGWYMCVVARNRVNHRFDELDKLVGVQADPIADDFCGNTIDYDWIMKQEGIPKPPQCPFGEVPDGNGGCRIGPPAAVRARSATDGSRPLSSYGPRLWGNRCEFHQLSP
jgi:hypothetical protein